MPTFYEPQSNHRIMGSTTNRLALNWDIYWLTVRCLEKVDQLSDYMTKNETCAEPTDEAIKL
jgi:hypothetical protein